MYGALSRVESQAVPVKIVRGIGDCRAFKSAQILRDGGIIYEFVAGSSAYRTRGEMYAHAPNVVVHPITLHIGRRVPALSVVTNFASFIYIITTDVRTHGRALIRVYIYIVHIT